MPWFRGARLAKGVGLLAFGCGLLAHGCGQLAAAAYGEQSVLDKPLGPVGGGVELSTRMAGVERAGLGTPLVDRRVDPHCVLASSAAGRLGDSLAKSLAPHRLGASELGGVIYIGPAAAARNLRTLAELNRRQAVDLDARSRAAMRRVDSLSWPRLTEPRQLIESLLAGHGLRLENPDQLPHDVWGEGRLSPMPLADRLTLLLIGFDLTWGPTDTPGVLKLSPAPREPVIEKRYVLAEQSSWDEQAFQDAFPDAALNKRGRRLELTGRVEAHEYLAAALRGESPAAADAPTTSGSNQRLTLTVKQQPAQAVLDKLAQTFSLSIRYNEAVRNSARQALSKRVDLSVSQATLSELLGRIGEQVGLGLTLEGQAIQVAPAEQ